MHYHLPQRLHILVSVEDHEVVIGLMNKFGPHVMMQVMSLIAHNVHHHSIGRVLSEGSGLIEKEFHKLTRPELRSLEFFDF
jgi:hypothetical protein